MVPDFYKVQERLKELHDLGESNPLEPHEYQEVADGFRQGTPDIGILFPGSYQATRPEVIKTAGDQLTTLYSAKPAIDSGLTADSVPLPAPNQGMKP